MGRLTFTEYFHLLLTGREPSDDERFFLDLLLVSIAEHGLMPSNVAARMTLAADPGVAARSRCRRDPRRGPRDPRRGGGVRPPPRRDGVEGKDAAQVARRDPRRWRQGARLRPSAAPSARSARGADPRARRRAWCQRRVTSHLRERCATRSPTRGASRCTLNVSLPIAAVMLDLGYSPAIVKAVPILARTASLLAHLAEEQEQPIGFLLAAGAEEAVEYRPD